MKDYEAMVVTVGQHKYWGKNMFQLPLDPQKIAQGLAWDRTRSSAVTGRRMISLGRVCSLYAVTSRF
jgi:hypothetical protein